MNAVEEKVKETKLAEKLRKADEAEAREHFEEACIASRAVLEEHVGRLVEYQESGTRIGYLVQLNPWTGTIQPLGSIGSSKPEEVLIDLPSIHACSAPTKYATLDEYAKAKGWNMKATLLLPGKQPAPKNIKVAIVAAPNAIVQALESDKKMVELIKPEPTLQPPDDMIVETVADAPVGKWNPERAVELYKSGMKIIDIAVAMGYPRGSGQNRTKGALKKAGVL